MSNESMPPKPSRMKLPEGAALKYHGSFPAVPYVVFAMEVDQEEEIL
jgi:hypothetical protein